MANLRGREIRESYKYILSLDAVTSARATGDSPAINASAKFVTDGNGVYSALRLGTQSATINGQFTVNGNVNIVGNLNTLSTSETNVVQGQFLGTNESTAANPTYSWVDDTNTGFYQPEVGLISVAIDGIDGFIFSTSSLAILNETPMIKLVDTNIEGVNTTGIYRDNNQFKISTLNDQGEFISDEYTIINNDSGATSHQFRILNTLVARIDSGGVTADFPETIITREKGDARYILSSEAIKIPTPLSIDRVDNVVNGGRVNFNRAVDNTFGIGIDAFGNSVDPTLRFFDINGERALLESRAAQLDNNISIVTREKGDKRYAQLSAINTFSEAQIIRQPNPTLILHDTASGNHRTTIQQFGNLYSRYIYSKDNGASILGEMRVDENVVSFSFGASAVAFIRPSGASLPEPETIVTREKGDARYSQLTATNKLSNDFILTNDDNDTIQRIVSIRNGSNYYNAALTFWTPRSDTANMASSGIRGYVVTAGENTDTQTNIFIGANTTNARVSGTATDIRNNQSVLEISSDSSEGVRYWRGGILSAKIDPAGSGTTDEASIITREKGDARYAQLSTRNTFTNVGAQTAPTLEFSNKTNSGAMGLYSVPSTSNGNNGDVIRFTINGVASADIEGVGSTAVNSRTVITREKGDARYIQQPIFGNFVENVSEFNEATAPVNQRIAFSSWERFTHNSTGVVHPATNNPDLFAGEQSAWTFDNTANLVRNTTNSSTVIGAVSEDKVTDYYMDIQLASTNGDDDYIGIVLAFSKEFDREYTLSMVRNNNATAAWFIAYNYGQTDGYTVANLSDRLALGTKFTNPGNNGWVAAGVGCPVRAIRTGDSIEVYSNDMGTTTIDTRTRFVIDLNSDSRLARFKEPSSYGFMSSSQANSSWKGDIFSGDIYRLDTDRRFRYNGSSWVATGSSVSGTLGDGTLIRNQRTNKTWIVRGRNDFPIIAKQPDLFYSGTDPNNAEYPVGTTLIVNPELDNTSLNRNNFVVIYTYTNNLDAGQLFWRRAEQAPVPAAANRLPINGLWAIRSRVSGFSYLVQRVQ